MRDLVFISILVAWGTMMYLVWPRRPSKPIDSARERRAKERLSGLLTKKQQLGAEVFGVIELPNGTQICQRAVYEVINKWGDVRYWCVAPYRVEGKWERLLNMYLHYTRNYSYALRRANTR